MKGIPLDIQVRDCVFESNSSSSHSLSISADNIFDMNFSQETLRSGVIKLVVPVDEHGDAVHFENEWHRFYTPENILLYMLIVAVKGKITAHFPDVDILPTLAYNYKRARDLADAPASRYRKRLRDLMDWVKRETGCRVELSFPAVPEPAPAPRSICIGSNQEECAQWLLKDHAALKSLIFSRKSYVETGYDNELAPYFIPTDDRGIETYFADRVVERADLASLFTLTASAGLALTYEDEDGDIVVSRDGSRVYDLYDLLRVTGPVNFHLVGCDITLPVYVSSLPVEMEELDVDLQTENKDRVLDLMNGFVSYAVKANAGSGDAASITMKPGFAPRLVEDGTSDKVARMPHDCKEFKVRIACDEATRLKVRAKSASYIRHEVATSALPSQGYGE
jgi:hypothetical protein